VRRAGWEDCDADLRERLRTEAERVKRELSASEEAAFRLPFYDGSRSLEEAVSREEFERLIAGELGVMARLCRRVLADARMEVAQLDAAVLVGGSTRVPAVQRLAAEVFAREPDCSQHPDEAVALGAAIQAGILAGTWKRVLLLDVTPLSLGIETLGGLMNVLIPRNTTIPCKAGEMFTNARDGQESMRVRILQGERELAADNWELGRFDLAFRPAPRGRARVGVQFALDENGLLEVLARDLESRREVVVTIDSAVSVADEAVERMVSESVAHAFEDMTARVFTEARLKAEELLPAVEAALEQWGGTLAADEREEIESARRAVEEALSSGAAARLKAEVERLDRATEPLAARLVEKAMAERLRAQLSEGEGVTSG
jgi:molecular chaperone DnaK